MTDDKIIDMFAQRDERIEHRFNSIETKVDELSGYLKGVVESNQKLIKLFTISIGVISFIAIMAVGAIIVGAIGKDGMHSVRQIIPDIVYAIPADNHEVDFWQYDKHTIV